MYSYIEAYERNYASEQNYIPLWCEVGTKLKWADSKSFGVIQKVDVYKHLVYVSWKNKKPIQYGINYLKHMIANKTIEIVNGR